MRIAVLALGILVIIVVGGGLLFGDASSSVPVEEFERSFVVADGQKVTVQSRNGPITYEVWDGSTVVIQATKEPWGRGVPFLTDWFARRIHVTFEQSAQGVRAAETGWGRFFFNPIRLRFVVLAPSQWDGDVELKTSNGRITASDLRGEATLKTSNGEITVERQAGRLNVNSSNGRITLKEIDGIVDAHTSNGPIRVEGARLLGTGRFRTSNGTIDLEAALVDDASYEVRTSNGRVGVVLVDADVTVNMRTSNGRIDLGTELIASQLDRNRLSGRIGAGTASLEVRTSNGNISLSTKP